jgi:hypothetical protein
VIVQVHTTASPPQAALCTLRYGDSKAESEVLDEPGDDDEMPWFGRWTRTSSAGEVSMPVGDVPVTFAYRSTGNSWYASAVLPAGECGLIVEAVNVRPDELSIVRIADVEPYVRGHRLALRAAWGAQSS